MRQLVSRYSVAHPRVYGSVLTGKDDDESGLDLLVDATERTTLFTLAGPEHEAQRLLGVHVSVLTQRLADEVPRQGSANGAASMKHPERIEDYLQHIAEATDRITGYVQGIDNAAELEPDHKTQAAVIRYIEIIGEAANRIQKQEPEFVAAHASLPWPEMRGMRNRMIHNYFDVNIDVLWGTGKDDLPNSKNRLTLC